MTKSGCEHTLKILQIFSTSYVSFSPKRFSWG